MIINDTHEGPTLHASRGYAKAALVIPHTGPIGTVTAAADTPARRRTQARAQVKQRKAEINSGAAFLRKLTTMAPGVEQPPQTMPHSPGEPVFGRFW